MAQICAWSFGPELAPAAERPPHEDLISALETARGQHLQARFAYALGTRDNVLWSLDAQEPLRAFARHWARMVVRYWHAPQAVLRYLHTGLKKHRLAAAALPWRELGDIWAPAWNLEHDAKSASYGAVRRSALEAAAISALESAAALAQVRAPRGAEEAELLQLEARVRTQQSRDLESRLLEAAINQGLLKDDDALFCKRVLESAGYINALPEVCRWTHAQRERAQIWADARQTGQATSPPDFFERPIEAQHPSERPAAPETPASRKERLDLLFAALPQKTPLRLYAFAYGYAMAGAKALATKLKSQAKDAVPPRHPVLSVLSAAYRERVTAAVQEAPLDRPLSEGWYQRLSKLSAADLREVESARRSSLLLEPIERGYMQDELRQSSPARYGPLDNPAWLLRLIESIPKTPPHRAPLLAVRLLNAVVAIESKPGPMTEALISALGLLPSWAQLSVNLELLARMAKRMRPLDIEQRLHAASALLPQQNLGGLCRATGRLEHALLALPASTAAPFVDRLEAALPNHEDPEALMIHLRTGIWHAAQGSPPRPLIERALESLEQTWSEALAQPLLQLWFKTSPREALDSSQRWIREDHCKGQVEAIVLGCLANHSRAPSPSPY